MLLPQRPLLLPAALVATHVPALFIGPTPPCDRRATRTCRSGIPAPACSPRHLWLRQPHCNGHPWCWRPRNAAGDPGVFAPTPDAGRGWRRKGVLVVGLCPGGFRRAERARLVAAMRPTGHVGAGKPGIPVGAQRVCWVRHGLLRSRRTGHRHSRRAVGARSCCLFAHRPRDVTAPLCALQVVSRQPPLNSVCLQQGRHAKAGCPV